MSNDVDGAGPAEASVRLCTCHPDDNPPSTCARRYALTECLNARAYQPIETAPVGKTIFVAIGVTEGNGFTAGKRYVTDPYCVWQEKPGVFIRWPHKWAPTHWCELPDQPNSVLG